MLLKTKKLGTVHTVQCNNYIGQNVMITCKTKDCTPNSGTN